MIGALTGSAIDPKTFGLDAAFPAGFIAMVWPLFSDPRARKAAAIGGVICLITVPFTPKRPTESDGIQAPSSGSGAAHPPPAGAKAQKRVVGGHVLQALVPLEAHHTRESRKTMESSPKAGNDAGDGAR